MDFRERVKPSNELKQFEEYVGVELPKVKIVCPTCRGEGKHVNPSIDAHGITQEEMYELGPEFEEGYFSGMYDVTCYECKGNNVVDVVDREYMEFNDPELLKEWDEWLRSARETEAMYESERRMGA